MNQNISRLYVSVSKRLSHAWLLPVGLCAVLVTQAQSQPLVRIEEEESWADQDVDGFIERYRFSLLSRGTPQEGIANQQMIAALLSGVNASGGSIVNRNLLRIFDTPEMRQYHAAGYSSNSSVKWSSVGQDGTPVTCIASSKASQIIWREKHAEMNPSRRRWEASCWYSSPFVKKWILQRVNLTKQRIEKRLRDPEGTRYRNVFLMASGYSVILCGQINTRNGFGGFDGYRNFIAGSTFSYLPDDSKGSINRIKAASYCTTKDGFVYLGTIAFDQPLEDIKIGKLSIPQSIVIQPFENPK